MTRKNAAITEEDLQKILASSAAKIPGNIDRLRGQQNASIPPSEGQQQTPKCQQDASKLDQPEPTSAPILSRNAGITPSNSGPRTLITRGMRLEQARRDYPSEATRVKVTVRVPGTLAKYIKDYRDAMRKANKRITEQAIYDEALCQWYADHPMPE